MSAAEQLPAPREETEITERTLARMVEDAINDALLGKRDPSTISYHPEATPILANLERVGAVVYVTVLRVLAQSDIFRERTGQTAQQPEGDLYGSILREIASPHQKHEVTPEEAQNPLGKRLAEGYVRGDLPRGDLLAVATRKENAALLAMLHWFLVQWTKLNVTAKGRVAELVSEMVKTYDTQDQEKNSHVVNAKLLALVVLAQGDASLSDSDHIDRLSIGSAVAFVRSTDTHLDAGSRWSLVSHLGDRLASVFADMHAALEQARNVVALAPGKPTVKLPEGNTTEASFKRVAPITPMPSRPETWNTPPARIGLRPPAGPAPPMPAKLRAGVAPEKPALPDDSKKLLLHLRAVGRSPRLDNEGAIDFPQHAWEPEERSLLQKHKQAVAALLLEEATNPSFKLEPEPKGEGLGAKVMRHLIEHRGQEVSVTVLRDMVTSPAAVAQGKQGAWLSSQMAKLTREGHPIRAVLNESGHVKGYVLEGEGS